MKNLRKILATVLLVISSAVMAQQETAITLYRNHLNLINPAYAGVDGQTYLTSTLRKQWAGIAKAPETQAVSFGTIVGKNLGLGVTMINDQTFIERQNFVSIDFSYKLKFSESTDLYLGIKAGANFYNVNTSGLETYNVSSDPALAFISNFNPNVGVGGVLKSEKWYASLSIPRLLSTERVRNEEGYAMVATDRPHVYLSGGYDYKLNSEFTLKPSMLMRYVGGVPISIDLNTILAIGDYFEIGAMYRTDKAYALISTINISKRFLFGFAYEMSTRPQMASARNTNEILLRFKF